MIKEIICKLFNKRLLHANEATEIKKKALNKAKRRNTNKADVIIATDISDEIRKAASCGENSCSVVVMESNDICDIIWEKLSAIYGYSASYNYQTSYGKFEISWR